MSLSGVVCSLILVTVVIFAPGEGIICKDGCSLSPEVGRCRALVPRWFYNKTSYSCQEFSYGGCEGNANNFLSEKECQTTCESDQVCKLPPKPGPCRARFRRWFFNTTSGKCDSFFYGGCQGNANKFESEENCANHCICSLPADTGPCKAAFTRWFYCPDTGNCEPFSYGGCGGNGNNFQTQHQCLKTCDSTDGTVTTIG